MADSDEKYNTAESDEKYNTAETRAWTASGAVRPASPGTFESVRLNNDQACAMSLLRSHFETLEKVIGHMTPLNGYRLRGLQALEEAAMWLNKSITHN